MGQPLVTVFPFSRRFKILLGCCWPGRLSITSVRGLLLIWTPLSIPCTFVMGKISPRNPSSFHNSHRHSEPRGGEVLSDGLSSNFGLWPGPPFPNVAYHRSVSTVQNAGPSWESRVLTEQAGEALGSIRHSKQTNKTEHKIEWPDTLQGYHVLTPCTRCTSSKRMESSCGWNCIMLWAAMCSGFDVLWSPLQICLIL